MVFPISDVYPATYEDARGIEQTTIYNNGEELCMSVRGVTFTGWMFDDFEPVSGTPEDALTLFNLSRGDNYAYLNSFTLKYQRTVPILMNDKVIVAPMEVRFHLGLPGSPRGSGSETFTLTLVLEEQTYISSGKSGCIEDELKELQAMLPSHMCLRMCINCAFSEYGIGGNGAFGCMACFRDNKVEYLNANGKFGVAQIWNTRSEWVQETYHCPEWERRRPGTGYRG